MAPVPVGAMLKMGRQPESANVAAKEDCGTWHLTGKQSKDITHEEPLRAPSIISHTPHCKGGLTVNLSPLKHKEIGHDFN